MKDAFGKPISKDDIIIYVTANNVMKTGVVVEVWNNSHIEVYNPSHIKNTLVQLRNMNRVCVVPRCM